MTSRELLAYLGERRSPKLSSLADPAPDDAQLRAILGVASRTPDHGRLVPWRFITIAGDCRYRLSAFIGERFAESHADANDERLEVMRHCLSRAPLVVAVVFSPRSHPKIPHWEQMLTVGAVCMNLLHGARAMGFAGLWLTEWYAYDRAVLDELGLAGDEQLAGFIHLGTSTEPRDDRLRPDLDDIVSAYSHGRTRSGGTS